MILVLFVIQPVVAAVILLTSAMRGEVGGV